MSEKILYCGNKECEVYNESQGDWGNEEGEGVLCGICGKKLSDNKEVK